jgi:hypothetical protein
LLFVKWPPRAVTARVGTPRGAITARVGASDAHVDAIANDVLGDARSDVSLEGGAQFVSVGRGIFEGRFSLFRGISERDRHNL